MSQAHTCITLHLSSAIVEVANHIILYIKTITMYVHIYVSGYLDVAYACMSCMYIKLHAKAFVYCVFTCIWC